MNFAAVDAALDRMVPIAIPEGWRTGEVRPLPPPGCLHWA